MSPWKHLSAHAIEQGYIRLGIDCYDLLMYLTQAEIKEVTKKWATENFNVLRRDKKHEYYTFTAPKTNVPVLAIVINGVVLTLLTQDIPDLNLKKTLRKGKYTITKTLGGGQFEYKGF
jgi:hypothetical protein